MDPRGGSVQDEALSGINYERTSRFRMSLGEILSNTCGLMRNMSTYRVFFKDFVLKHDLFGKGIPSTKLQSCGKL